MLTKTCACLGLAMLAGCVPVMNAYKLQKAQSEVNANKPDEAQATLDSCFDSHSAENIVGVLWAVSLGAYYTPICMLYKNSDPTFVGLEKQISKEQQEQAGKAASMAELKSAATALGSENYTVARDHYFNASKSNYLNDSQRREALDGICLAEYKAGEVSYSIETQYRDCLDASKQSGDVNGPLATELETRLKSYYEVSLQSAIDAKEHAKSEELLEKYKVLPGANQERISKWEGQLQRIIPPQHQDTETGLINGLVCGSVAKYYLGEIGFYQQLKASGMSDDRAGVLTWQKASLDASYSEEPLIAGEAYSVLTGRAFDPNNPSRQDIQEYGRVLASVSRTVVVVGSRGSAFCTNSGG
jgi:hypothetical protein